MGSFISSLAGLAAAWLAVGGGGLLAHPLRCALVALAGLVAAVLGWPRQKLSWPQRGVLLAGVMAAGGLATSNQPAVAVWAVCILLAVLSAAGRDEDKFPLRLAARATAILGVYRLVIEAIPWAWTAADKLAGGLSTAAGALSGGRLWTGPTFAGLDYLIVMAALLALARRERALSAVRLGVLAGAIVLGHLAYLALLAHLPGVVESWVKSLPVEAARGAAHAPRQAFWPGLVKQAVPWNLPAVAGLIHLCLAGWLLAWSARCVARQAATRFKPATAAIAAATCAALLSLIAVVSWPLSAGGLEGKKIVLFEKGFLNWEKPAFGKYGRVYTGMYGMTVSAAQVPAAGPAEPAGGRVGQRLGGYSPMARLSTAARNSGAWCSARSAAQLAVTVTRSATSTVRSTSRDTWTWKNGIGWGSPWYDTLLHTASRPATSSRC